MKIAVVGDYDQNRPSHLATSEAIEKSAVNFSQEVEVEWLPTLPLETVDERALLREFDGIWGAPGDHQSSLGYIKAIQFARETDLPYLGTWSGFQHALAEYGLNALNIHLTIDPPNISELFSVLITPMSCALLGETQEISIRRDSLARRIYQKESVIEKYNCGYSLNEDYRDRFEQSELRIVGVNPDGHARMIELPDHRFFLAMLFQPQLHMSESPHPVIVSFLEEAGNQEGRSAAT